MIFCILALSEDGVVTGSAKGHADDVIRNFHAVSQLLLGSRGPWRITDVTGSIPDGDVLDSDMQWTLIAKSKDRGV